MFHFERITTDLREDLVVWRKVLSSFNGSSFWQAPFCTDVNLDLFTDVSGSVGYGVYWQGHWSADRWPVSWQAQGFTNNIALLEIFPVVISLDLWGGLFC